MSDKVEIVDSIEELNSATYSNEKPNDPTLSVEKTDYVIGEDVDNIADVQVLITSNEGWGLTITEAMLAGTPIIANATGGMQDQMLFRVQEVPQKQVHIIMI